VQKDFVLLTGATGNISILAISSHIISLLTEKRDPNHFTCQQYERNVSKILIAFLKDYCFVSY